MFEGTVLEIDESDILFPALYALPSIELEANLDTIRSLDGVRPTSLETAVSAGPIAEQFNAE